jgi:Rieske 2Fe-2S family protein
MGNVTGTISDDAPEPLSNCCRIPIRDGFLTQSRDGQPVAPLMGSFKEYDGGYTGGRMYPLSYFVASCDHAVIPRFTPRGPTTTDVEMIWLVRSDAVEGRDYDLEKADLAVESHDRSGQDSGRQQPSRREEHRVPAGPYSKTEQGLTWFTMWYLRQIA